MKVRSATLTVGALFALSVPAANAAVIFGDGAGVSTTTRTPAVAAGVKHHVAVKKHATVKEAPSLLPADYYQVKRNLI